MLAPDRERRAKCAHYVHWGICVWIVFFWGELTWTGIVSRASGVAAVTAAVIVQDRAWARARQRLRETGVAAHLVGVADLPIFLVVSAATYFGGRANPYWVLSNEWCALLGLGAGLVFTGLFVFAKALELHSLGEESSGDAAVHRSGDGSPAGGS